MNHIALLGDSVFDNAAYVGKGAVVIDQLRAALARGDRATLCAVDGHTTRMVPGQLSRAPADATHVAVSAGGNDALGNLGMLQYGAGSVADALATLAEVADAFERDHAVMLAAIAKRGLPTLVCSIYNPRFDDASLQRVAVAALAHFNDAILRNAFRAGLPVLDLRLVCTEAAHYANEIEPSSAGGERIARGIARAIREHDFSSKRTSVFGA